MATTTSTRPRLQPLVLGGVALVVAVVAAVWWHRSSAPVRTETVSCLSADEVVSCDLADGWTIAIPTDVAWTDSGGTFHEDGRPRCLPPTGVGLEGPVQVSWTPVEAGGAAWRQVVWVGC